MIIDPSVNQYINDPNHYQLEMAGGTLRAVGGHTHTISYQNLQELQGMADQANALAGKVLNTLRKNQIWDDRIPQDKIPADMQADLNHWCESAIGTPEYVNRCRSATSIERAFVGKWELLDLRGQQLTSLPHSIVNLGYLTDLNISQNRLAHLPEHFGNLARLRVLNASGNQLIELPRSVENLKSLKTIDLRNNALTTLPIAWARIDFGHMYVDGNRLPANVLVEFAKEVEQAGKEFRLVARGGAYSHFHMPHDAAGRTAIQNLRNAGIDTSHFI